MLAAADEGVNVAAGTSLTYDLSAYKGIMLECKNTYNTSVIKGQKYIPKGMISASFETTFSDLLTTTQYISLRLSITTTTMTVLQNGSQGNTTDLEIYGVK